MRRNRLSLALLFAAALSLPAMAPAAVHILNHDTSNTVNTSAVCLAAPNRETGSIVVSRIRITSSRATPTTYTFTHMRTSDAVNDTEDVSGCSLSSCATVLTVEGVVAGRVADLTGLALELPPGSRLYASSDSDIGAAHHTIEVVYRQK